MIGILFFLFEFYDDQLLAFMVLILVWLCELFTLIRFVRVCEWMMQVQILKHHVVWPIATAYYLPSTGKVAHESSKFVLAYDLN